MGSISNFLECKFLDHVCNTAYSPSATIYLGLCTADPTDAATGAACNEVPDAGAYARKAITFGGVASRKVTQDALVTFTKATDVWGHVSHWVVVNSITYGAGDVLAFGEFTVHKDIVLNNTPSVASGQVYVEYTAGEISDYLVGKLLELAFRNVAYSKPATYVAFCTSVVVDADTTLAGKEVTNAGAYARKLVNINGGASPTWDFAVASDPSYVDNTHAITFTPASADWSAGVPIVAVAICDNGTWNSVNMLFYDNTMADQPVQNGDTADFAIGVLDLQMS